MDYIYIWHLKNCSKISCCNAVKMTLNSTSFSQETKCLRCRWCKVCNE